LGKHRITIASAVGHKCEPGTQKHVLQLATASTPSSHRHTATLAAVPAGMYYCYVVVLLGSHQRNTYQGGVVGAGLAEVSQGQLDCQGSYSCGACLPLPSLSLPLHRVVSAGIWLIRSGNGHRVCRELPYRPGDKPQQRVDPAICKRNEDRRSWRCEGQDARRRH